jgi:hypothetical protein
MNVIILLNSLMLKLITRWSVYCSLLIAAWQIFATIPLTPHYSPAAITKIIARKPSLPAILF